MVLLSFSVIALLFGKQPGGELDKKQGDWLGPLQQPRQEMRLG